VLPRMPTGGRTQIRIRCRARWLEQLEVIIRPLWGRGGGHTAPFALGLGRNEAEINQPILPEELFHRLKAPRREAQLLVPQSISGLDRLHHTVVDHVAAAAVLDAARHLVDVEAARNNHASGEQQPGRGPPPQSPSPSGTAAAAAVSSGWAAKVRGAADDAGIDRGRVLLSGDAREEGVGDASLGIVDLAAEAGGMPRAGFLRARRRSTAAWRVSEARRLKALEDEKAKLKRLLAEAMLDNVMLKDIASKKW
jgi:putative transposase